MTDWLMFQGQKLRTVASAGSEYPGDPWAPGPLLLGAGHLIGRGFHLPWHLQFSNSWLSTGIWPIVPISPLGLSNSNFWQSTDLKNKWLGFKLMGPFQVLVLNFIFWNYYVNSCTKAKNILIGFGAIYAAVQISKPFFLKSSLTMSTSSDSSLLPNYLALSSPLLSFLSCPLLWRTVLGLHLNIQRFC